MRRTLWTNALTLTGLWAFAVAQPLLDLYGQNGELFVAAGQSSPRIVAFAFVVVAGVPATLIVVEALSFAVSRRVGDLLHGTFVVVLGTMLGASLLRTLSAAAPSVALALLFGAALFYGSLRVPAVATGLRYLAVGPLVFLVAFLFFSRSSRLVFDDSAEAGTGATVGRPVPVVVLQLDELPVASLLNDELTVNRERFPHFAALADQSTWYPEASSVAAETTLSVPSVVTGLVPDDDDLPVAADLPQSLFTLLGDDYTMNVHEQVTRLCPTSICDDPGGDHGEVASLWAMVQDAAVVYGHVALPPSLADDLPRVDQGWGGFLGDAHVDPAAAQAPNDGFDVDRTETEVAREGPARQGAAMQELIDSLGTTAEPSLTYAHVLLPHGPWLMTPTDQQHSEPSPLLGLDTAGAWVQQEGARQGLQRHLLQVGYLDLQLGRFIDRMKSTRLWDEALVVVTADHGVAFRPGQPMRTPSLSTVAELYNVPLFVKYPGQDAGATVPGPVALTDVLPTIVDALEIDTEWRFDGHSLLAGVDRTGPTAVVEPEVPDGVPGGIDGVAAVVRRNRSLLPRGTDWRGVAAIAPYADLVGQPLARLAVAEPSPLTWTSFSGVEAYDPASARSPVLQTGVLHVAGGAAPEAGLIAVNGTVVGVAVGFDVHAGDAAFSAVITPEFFQYGYNDVRLLVPDTEGGRIFHEVPLTG